MLKSSPALNGFILLVNTAVDVGVFIAGFGCRSLIDSEVVDPWELYAYAGML